MDVKSYGKQGLWRVNKGIDLKNVTKTKQRQMVESSIPMKSEGMLSCYILRGEIHSSNAINSSIEPLIRNLTISVIEIARFSRDLVTTIERLLNASSQCLCRPLFRSIAEVYFLDCVKLFWGKKSL